MTQVFSRVSRATWCWFLLVGGVALWGVGCGEPKPPQGTLEGTVLLNDTPYENAAIMFYSPTTGPAGIAELQPGGTFKLDTPVAVGKYTAYLTPKAVPEDPSGAPVPVSIDSSVPEKYWNEATSDVTVEVKEGPNTVTVKFLK